MLRPHARDRPSPDPGGHDQRICATYVEPAGRPDGGGGGETRLALVYRDFTGEDPSDTPLGRSHFHGQTSVESTVYCSRVTAKIVARITVSAHDEIEADQAAHQLLDELRESDVALLVDRAATTTPPDGARSSELIAIGTLLITVLAQPELLAALLTQIGDWLGRRGAGRGRVEIELDGQVLIIEHATPEEQRRLVDAYIKKVLSSDS
jgi:hypothetical protein